MASIARAAKALFTKRPLLTNCVIYGSLYVGAEFSQQTLTRKILPKKPLSYNSSQLARYGIIGYIISPAINFFWYKWLDRTLPGTAGKIIVKKLLLDQFFLTPNLLVLFFSGMAIMEQAPDIFAELKEKFVPTFLRSCIFWLPAQTANFMLIPPRFRVVYVGTCSFVWVNILCYIKRQDLKSDSIIDVKGKAIEG